MTVYRVKGNVRQYKSLSLNSIDLAQQLNRLDALATLVNFPSLNAPLLPMWGDVSAIFTAESKTAVAKPDLITWASGALYMSISAYELLHRRLEHEGEFLPVSVEGDPGYIFNNLELAKEDPDYTVNRYFDGEKVGLEHLEFDRRDLERRMLFKSERESCGTLYCTDEFKELCEMNNLNGLIFDEKLLNPFV